MMQKATKSTQVQYIDELLAVIDDKKALIQGLRLRIVFLEQRLEQRHEKTVSHYDRVMRYAKNMREMEMKIFLELPPNVGLLHEEIRELFEKRYPNVPTKNLPRRTRENVVEGKLWSKQDPDGKARFYLKLKDLQMVKVE